MAASATGTHMAIAAMHWQAVLYYQGAGCVASLFLCESAAGLPAMLVSAGERNTFSVCALRQACTVTAARRARIM
jgi:hypothetical protein